MVTLELVSIPTGRRTTAPESLDGLLYRPEGPPRGTALLMHGNTTNFYARPLRVTAARLADAGFACLSYNRRGHDILTTLEGKRLGGGAFQTIADDLEDNDAAAAWMTERGLAPSVVVGHSNGGMLGAQFAADHPDLSALVLLSAHKGGVGTYSRTSRAGRLAGDRAEELLARARELVAADQGDVLIFTPHWWTAISAASLVDREDNVPDLLANAGQINCPTLFVVGDTEEPYIYPAEEFAKRAAGQCEVAMIPGADHWYTGCVDQVADRVVRFLLTDALG